MAISERSPFSRLLPEFAIWLERQGYSKRTGSSYVATARTFLEEYGIGAGTDSLRRWRDQIEHAAATDGTTKDASPSTINVRIAALRALFSFAVEHGYREDNPMGASGIRLLPVPRRTARPIARDALNALYEFVYHQPEDPVGLQDRALLEVLYCSGLRREEAATVRLGSFTGNDKLKVIGKGNKERITIVMPEELEAVSRWALSHLGDDRTAVLAKEIGPAAAFEDLRKRFADAFLFYTTRQDRTVTKEPMASLDDPGNGIWRRCAVWFKGVGAHFTPHQFRHTFATDIFSSGGTLEDVGQLLGHEDQRSTLIYTGVNNTFFTRMRKLHPRAEASNG